MSSRVAFLHTAPVHVATFTGLLQELAPGVDGVHVVDESLLADARAHGIEYPALLDALDRRLQDLAAGGVPVMCTCSTIGGLAEARGAALGATVLRVDRAMADAAVAAGPRIAVVAALASTLEPTTALIEDCARRVGREVQLDVVLCAEAWPYFERGDVAAYLEAVQAAVDAHRDVDVVVLAQASMAPVAERQQRVPVLASPRLGVAALVALAG